MNEKCVSVRFVDDIELCADKSGLGKIFEVINDGAQAYKDIIPDDCWHEPYMPFEELRKEIEAGIVFWGLEYDAELQGVMGIQDKGEVTLKDLRLGSELADKITDRDEWRKGQPAQMQVKREKLVEAVKGILARYE